MTATNKADCQGPRTMFDGEAADIDGRRCLGALRQVSDPGTRVMFVQHCPDPSESRMGKPYSSRQSQLLLETLDKAGFDTSAA